MRTVFPGRTQVAISDDGVVSDSTRYRGKSIAFLVAVKNDLDECGVSRDQMAFALSGELGYPVTVAQIDAIVAPTKANRMPAEWIPAWVKATGSRRLLDVLCADCGLTVATSEDREFAEFGRHQLASQDLALRLRGRL